MITCKAIDVRKLVEADEPRFVVTVNEILMAVTDRRRISKDFPWAVQIWGEELPEIDYRSDRCLVTCSQKIPAPLGYAYGNAAIDTCKAFIDEFGADSIPEIFNFIASIGRDSSFYTDELRSRYPIPSQQPPLELRKYLVRAYEQSQVWQDRPSPISPDAPWECQLPMESERVLSAV